MSEICYVLISWVQYEGSSTHGVFSSRESAKSAADALGLPRCGDFGQTIETWRLDGAHVEETERKAIGSIGDYRWGEWS